MEPALELRKYHLIEHLMRLSDTGIINKIEKIIYNQQIEEPTKKEMMQRAAISEKQLKEGKVKTHAEAKKRLDKWLK